MAELIDYLFFFWIFLTIAVYVLGSIYEKQIKGKSKEQQARRQPSVVAQLDSWSPTRYSISNQEQNSNLNQFGSYSTNSSALYTDNKQNSPTIVTANYYSNQPSSTYFNYSNVSSTNQAAQPFEHQAHFSATQHQPLSVQDPYSNYTPIQTDAVIPTATGFNVDCVNWVNNILYLFYTDAQKYGPIIAESVYRSLNEKLFNILNSMPEFSDVVIEFKGINQQLSSRPELTNVRTESESEKSVSVNCKIYNQRLILDMTIERSKSINYIDYNQRAQMNRGEDDVFHYELVLENLEGKLKSVAMLNDRLIVVQFLEKPDTKILLRPKYHSNEFNLVNEDTLVSVILQTITQVVVDLYFGDDVDFPQYKHQQASGYRNKLNMLKGSASELKRQIKHDFFGSLSLSSSENKERKVFIKILKAKNINYNQNVTCLLELDTPYQQAMSSTKQGSNPFWDEHFLFNINEKSSELLLELWDSIDLPHADQGSLKKSGSLPRSSTQAAKMKWSKAEITLNGKFLGSARISIDDVRRNPVQNISLMLQSSGSTKQRESIGVGGGNPLAAGAITSDFSNSIGGELVIELLFLEHNPSAGLHKSNSTNSAVSYHQQGDVVSVDRKLTPSGYVITTTTITKPQSSSAKNKHQSHDQLMVRNQSPISSMSEHSELIDLNLDGISSNTGGFDSLAGAAHHSDGQQQQSSGLARSRSRSRSRTFLNAIRKRFSFSRTRSRSVGAESGTRPDSAARASNNLDTGSIDSRSRASSDASMMGGGRAKSVPASREPSEVPVIVINRGRGSDTASALTFTHPKSQLVIECAEPKLKSDGSVDRKGRLSYYAIPDDSASRSKWRRRGTKLHVFNEHQFIACHLAGSSTCHLCGKVFSRRPGKQGYKCRNCHLLSHKQCHVKVDHNCPYAAKDGLKLEYIDADPPASLVESRRGDSVPREIQSRAAKLSSKSISMEVDDR